MDSSNQHGRSYLQEGIHQAFGLAWGNENSGTRTALEDIAATALTMAPAIFLRGKLGYAGSAAVSALNQADVGDPTDRQLEDLAIGAAKGLALKGLYDRTLGKSDDRFFRNSAAFAGGLLAIDVGFSRHSLSSLGFTANTDGPVPTSASQVDASGFHSSTFVPRFTNAEQPTTTVQPENTAVAADAATAGANAGHVAAYAATLANAGLVAADAATVATDPRLLSTADSGTAANVIPAAPTESMPQPTGFAPSQYGEEERMLPFDSSPDQLGAVAGVGSPIDQRNWQTNSNQS